MKIIISTDDGEVLTVIESDEIGDLSKPLARIALMDEILDIWERQNS